MSILDTFERIFEAFWRNWFIVRRLRTSIKCLSKKMFIVRRLRSTIKFSKILKNSPKIFINHQISNSPFPSMSAAGQLGPYLVCLFAKDTEGGENVRKV